jgi:hypothetical protein
LCDRVCSDPWQTAVVDTIYRIRWIHHRMLDVLTAKDCHCEESCIAWLRRHCCSF